MRRQIRGPAFTERNAERNERIFTGFKKGRTQRALGNEFCLKQSSVSWICKCWFLSEGGELKLHYKARDLLYFVTHMPTIIAKRFVAMGPSSFIYDFLWFIC